MRILYGVQATGNGHITRARAMAPALASAGIEVDYLFSGREPEKLFDMEDFGDFRCHAGLTFAIASGRIRYLETLKRNLGSGILHDVLALDLAPYDLVLTDFEPITAWAARLRKRPSVAIGHQYALLHDVPKAGNDLLAKAVIRWFAPADIQIGLHWDRFGGPILPPLIEPPALPATSGEGRILVYLPFEDTDEVVGLLGGFVDHRFQVYCSIGRPTDLGHIVLEPFSRHRFQSDLARADGVISNAGFELASEALQYGKKILVKPIEGQMEQWSNAAALTRLKMGRRMDSLDRNAIASWLEAPAPRPVRYPDVASALTNWIQSGRTEPVDSLSRRLWNAVPP